MPHPFRFSVKERRWVGNEISRLGLDQAGVDGALAKLEGVANIHLLRDPVVRQAPTALHLAKSIAEIRRNFQIAYEELVASRLLTSNVGANNGDPRLEAKLGRVISQMDRNLADKLAVIGVPKKRSKNNNAKPSRDQFWEDVIRIWVAAGGEQTGKQLADFLVLVTESVERTAKVLTMATARNWLDRRAKIKSRAV